jgi:hypothetical protein
VKALAAVLVMATAGVSAQGDVRVATVVGTYCASCHNGRLRSPGGLLLENLLAYAASGSLPASVGTPETLVRARRILRATPARWSALIGAAVM